MSDSHLILTIVSLFVIIGAFLPFVQTEFEGSSTTTNYNLIGDSMENDLGNSTTTDYSGLGIATSGVNIFLSVVSMFFWTFGSLPLYLDVFLLIPRIMLGVLFARWLRGS